MKCQVILQVLCEGIWSIVSSNEAAKSEDEMREDASRDSFTWSLTTGTKRGLKPDFEVQQRFCC